MGALKCLVLYITFTIIIFIIVVVISSDSQSKDVHARFTKVPFENFEFLDIKSQHSKLQVFKPPHFFKESSSLTI